MSEMAEWPVVPSKEAAFPICTATESLWRRFIMDLASPVTWAKRRPRSLRKSIDCGLTTPDDSMATAEVCADSGTHTWPFKAPLPLVCGCCHSSGLPGSTRRIGRSKSVGAGYVPNQQPRTFPRDQSDAIRTFSIHTIEARWFQAGWYFCCSKSPVHNVV